MTNFALSVQYFHFHHLTQYDAAVSMDDKTLRAALHFPWMSAKGP
jgi:hypothetical protein